MAQCLIIKQGHRMLTTAPITKETLQKNSWFALLLMGAVFLPFLKIGVFFQHYVFPKWLLVYTICTLLSIKCLTLKNFSVPRFNKNLQTLFLLLFLTLITNHLIHDISFLTAAFGDRLCFILITLAIYNLMKEQLLKPQDLCLLVMIPAFLFLTINFSQLLQAAGLITTKSFDLSGSLGNINFSADFIACALLLCIAARPQFKQYEKGVDAFIYTCLLYCYFASSRSVFVALFIVGSILLFLRYVTPKYILKQVCAIACTLLLLNLFPYVIDFVSHWISFDKTQLNKIYLLKPESTSVRWELVLATLDMIKNNPFGVGPGNFALGFLPYSHLLSQEVGEDLIMTSPHCEYLRIIAEDGIPFTLLLLTLGGIALKTYLSKIPDIIKNHPILVTFISYYTLQCLFQFPLLWPGPFFFIACFMGYLLFVLCGDETTPLSKSLWGTSVLGFSFFIFTYFASEYLMFNYPNSSDLNQLSARLNPSNWYAPIQAAYAELNRGDEGRAKKLLKEELKKHPTNYLAMSLLSDLAEQNGNFSNACTLRQQVVSYFGKKSRYASFVKNRC